MPVRRTGPNSNSNGTPKGSNTSSSGHASNSSSTSIDIKATSTSLKAAVVPLTVGNLSSWTDQHGAGKQENLNPVQRIIAGHASAELGYNRMSTSTVTSGSSVVSVNNAMATPTTGRNPGLGLGLAGTSRPTAATPGSTMLGAGTKRYTRQMAHPTSDDAATTSNGATTLQASDLRARARVTSGSAPRRKVGIPGAERADAPSIGAETPHRRTRSNSRPTPLPVPPMPSSSRPPSRAGGESMFSPPSRPQSRMDDYGRSNQNAGLEVLETPMRSLSLHVRGGSQQLPSLRRRDSSDSFVLAPTPNGQTLVGPASRNGTSRKENVVVCVRVRPVLGTSGLVGQNRLADVEEAWSADEERSSIKLLPNMASNATVAALAADYRFGEPVPARALFLQRQEKTA